jgi:hypothetical protein
MFPLKKTLRGGGALYFEPWPNAARPSFASLFPAARVTIDLKSGGSRTSEDAWFDSPPGSLIFPILLSLVLPAPSPETGF